MKINKRINSTYGNYINNLFKLSAALFDGLSFLLILLLLCAALCSSSYSQQIDSGIKFDEKQLKENFDKFVSKLDSLSISKKYPEISKKILSADADQQKIALRMLSESEEVDSIPWAILLLNADDEYVRIYAGKAIENIISSIVLKRRDPAFPQYVLIKPLGKNDVDLKPFAWISLKLMRSGEPNLCSYGITIARYLNLYEFQDEILKQRDSVHPAVTDTVKWAVESLDLQKKYDSGELQKSANLN